MDERDASGVVAYVKRTDRAAITQKIKRGLILAHPLTHAGSMVYNCSNKLERVACDAWEE